MLLPNTGLSLVPLTLQPICFLTNLALSKIIIKSGKKKPCLELHVLNISSFPLWGLLPNPNFCGILLLWKHSESCSIISGNNNDAIYCKPKQTFCDLVFINCVSVPSTCKIKSAPKHIYLKLIKILTSFFALSCKRFSDDSQGFFLGWWAKTVGTASRMDLIRTQPGIFGDHKVNSGYFLLTSLARENLL